MVLVQAQKGPGTLLLLPQRLMMNRQNLSSKESVGVKFKENICADFWLKLWSVSDWYFYFTKTGWFFESDSPERKF